MDNWIWQLSGNQHKAIRYLYNLRAGGSWDYPDRETIITEAGLTDSEYESLISRLDSLGLVDVVEADGFAYPAVRGEPELASIIQSLDNPPPKDYWKSLTVWFRSKWWSIPVFIVTVVLPAVVGYVELVQKVVKYFSGE